jgi:hypothetical protein
MTEEQVELLARPGSWVGAGGENAEEREYGWIRSDGGWLIFFTRDAELLEADTGLFAPFL